MISYKKLEVWTHSMETVKQIYLLTKFYPSDEQYGLISQTKRAAVSIPANIAEGLGRKHKKDTIQFLHISRGSAYELETLISVAFMIEIISNESYNRIYPNIESNTRLLSGFINYLNNKPSTIHHLP